MWPEVFGFGSGAPECPPRDRRPPRRVPLPPVAPVPAAPRLDQGVEGAERGLRDWLREQTGRRFLHTPAPHSGPEPPQADAEAAAEAAHVLATYLAYVPPGLTARLVIWLQRHMEAARRGENIIRWQWDLPIIAWLCEERKLPAALQRYPAVAEDLLVEARFSARAL